MLRAVRLRPCSALEIGPSTWEAVRGSRAFRINEISAERIREELVRIFMSSHGVARLGSGSTGVD